MAEQGSILVVEDDEFVCNSLKWLLTDEGYDVDVATHGKQALEMVETTVYDLVITDLMMPEVDGLEVLKKVKAMGRETSVIVLTGYGTIEAAVRAMEEGAFDFLTKPCDDLEMKFKILNALEMKRLKTRIRQLEEKQQQDVKKLSLLQKHLICLADKIGRPEEKARLAECLETLDGLLRIT